MKIVAKYLLWIGFLSALATPAFAETRTISWSAVTTYTDGTSIVSGTVSYIAYWSTDSGLATLNPIVGGSPSAISRTFDPDLQIPKMTRGGTVYFTVKAVLDAQESAFSTAYPWVVPVVTTPGSLSASPAGGLTSSGTAGGSFTPSSQAYTLTNTGGTAINWTAAKTQSWVTLSPASGTLAAGGTATVTASINSAANGLSAGSYSDTVTLTNTTNGTGNTTRPVRLTAVTPTATLSGITISGPTSVNEGGTATYAATATWSDGATSPVTPTWSVSPTTYASISAGGVLTAATVSSDQPVTVTAGYGGKTGTKSVTIVDVPSAAPAAPKNIGISGPVSSAPTEIWRLHWDPVTTKWDGTPIDSARTVRYTAYWTDDPALPDRSLRQLNASISGTVQEFDPSANQMEKNREVYLTVRAILDTGEQSSLGASVPWRVSNEGPIPPEGGKIYKK